MKNSCWPFSALKYWLVTLYVSSLLKSFVHVVNCTQLRIEISRYYPKGWFHSNSLPYTHHTLSRFSRHQCVLVWLEALYTHESSNSHAYCACAQPSLSYEYLYAVTLRSTPCSNATAINNCSLTYKAGSVSKAWNYLRAPDFMNGSRFVTIFVHLACMGCECKRASAPWLARRRPERGIHAAVSEAPRSLAVAFLQFYCPPHQCPVFVSTI